jgi:MFS family permease
LLGSQITVIAVPLTAIMLLGATPLEVGVVTACGYLPFLLIGLPVGVLVDRWRLRRLLIVSDVARAVVLGCVPLAYALGVLSIPLLASAMFVHGALAAFADTAHPSFLPVLVSRDQLVEGNTKLQGSYSVAEFAGPGLGGVLVSVLTAPFALLIDAASVRAMTARAHGPGRRSRSGCRSARGWPTSWATRSSGPSSRAWPPRTSSTSTGWCR